MSHWLTVFAFDYGRYLVAAGGFFAVFWGLDVAEHRRIQLRRPPPGRIAHELGWSALTALIFASLGYGTYLASEAGWTRVYTDVSDYGWFYWLASIPAMLVLHDAYFYWTHRLIHHPRLYRLVHRTHHRSTNPTPWAAYSFSPLEAVVQGLIVPLLSFVMPLHPAAIFAFLAIMILMNALGHSGVELYPSWFIDSRVGRWLTTSTHHNLHHRRFRGNYGLYFTWWDRLCNTLHPDYESSFRTTTGRTPRRAWVP